MFVDESYFFSRLLSVINIHEPYHMLKNKFLYNYKLFQSQKLKITSLTSFFSDWVDKSPPYGAMMLEGGNGAKG